MNYDSDEPYLYASRESEDSYLIDFREIYRNQTSIARGTLFACRCIAALHGARLVVDGAHDRTDMTQVLPTIAQIFSHNGPQKPRSFVAKAGVGEVTETEQAKKKRSNKHWA